MKTLTAPLAALRHHVSGAIARGEASAIVGIPAAKWRAIRWPNNHAPEYQDVYPCHARRLGRGRIILHPGMWPAEGWSYVASFGASSDRSHSGFLLGFVSLHSAQAEIERRISIGSF